MGIFLKAAYTILKETGSPLTAKELTEKARASHILETSGLTPHQTMKAKISTDILKYKQKSLFKRTCAGKFGLQEWAEENEYTAQRYVKAIFDEDILVFKKEHLLNIIKNDGFIKTPYTINELIEKLRPIIFTARRKYAEEDESIIQLISVFVVRYKDLILTHKRTKRLPESRLHDFYSVMFGGHLTKNDFMPLLGEINFEREMSEELRLKFPPNIIFRGLIYDSSKDVSKIHLGLVFDVKLQNDEYIIGERGYLTDAKFETIDGIKRRIHDFENWSQTLVNAE